MISLRKEGVGDQKWSTAVDPIPQTEEGGNSMKNRNLWIPCLWKRVFRAKGSPLARLLRLCYRIKFDGLGVSLIPGLITCNISFRAGGSGRTYHKLMIGY